MGLDRSVLALVFGQTQEYEICYDCLKGAHMAEMIPDRLPHRASAGEKKVFALLQQLPDDVIVY